MKKITLLAALFSAASFCFAEDVLQIKPFETTAGLTADDYSTCELIFNCESFQTNSMRFYVYLPEGMDLITDFDDSDGMYAISLDDSRVTYSKMGKTQNTNHGVTYNKLGVKDGYVEYVVIISSTGTTPLQKLTGKLADVYYKTADDMPAGVYPIYIRSVELNNSAEQEYLYNSNTSYVKVGEPTGNQTVVFEGKIPSFVNEALATETAITSLNLSAVTEVNGTFTYVDGREVVAPTADVTANVAYKRSVAAGKYASVCLPFNANLSCYTYSETSGDYAIFSPATSLSADTPAIVSGNIDVTAEGVTLGNATKQTKNTGYYLKDGSFCKVNGTATIPALRGWWDLDTPSSNLRLMIDGTLTDINLLDVDAAEADAYDLQGRRSASAKNGVYVVNGKKQLVK